VVFSWNPDSRTSSLAASDAKPLSVTETVTASSVGVTENSTSVVVPGASSSVPRNCSAHAQRNAA
jgi:hypothetical protein